MYLTHKTDTWSLGFFVPVNNLRTLISCPLFVYIFIYSYIWIISCILYGYFFYVSFYIIGSRILMRPPNNKSNESLLSCSSWAVTLLHPLLASVNPVWWFPSVSQATQFTPRLRRLQQSPSHCSQTTVTSGIQTHSPVDWTASPAPHAAALTGPLHQSHRASSPQVMEQ